MKAWKVKSSQQVYCGRSLRVWNDVCDTEHNGEIEYCYAEITPWVLAIALNDQKQIILTRHYRHPIQHITNEFPAGSIDENESPQVAVCREVREETGYEFVDFYELGTWYEAVGKAKCRLTAFMGFLKGPQIRQSLDDDEDIECIFKTAAQIDEMIKCGEIISAPYIAAFYAALKRYPDFF